MIEIKKDPTRGELRVFGLLLLLFFGIVGGIVYAKTGRSLEVARLVWGGGLLLTVIYFLVPAVRRPLYLGWMYAAYPIGWTVSHVLMGLIDYVVLTPIGILMRLTGYDPMQRKLDAGAESYWIERKPPKSVERYFRQF